MRYWYQKSHLGNLNILYFKDFYLAWQDVWLEREFFASLWMDIHYANQYKKIRCLWQRNFDVSRCSQKINLGLIEIRLYFFGLDMLSNIFWMFEVLTVEFIITLGKKDKNSVRVVDFPSFFRPYYFFCVTKILVWNQISHFLFGELVVLQWFFSSNSILFFLWRFNRL